jgi:hypothetical protein
VLVDDDGEERAGRLGHRRIASIALDSFHRKDGRGGALGVLS